MQQQTQALVPNQQKWNSLKTLLEKQVPSIAAALPQTMKKYVTPDRIVKIALLSVNKNPTLMQCTQLSLIESIIDLASLGLEVGGPLGHAYLVPYRDRKKGIMVCQPIVGYRGFIELARRSGDIKTIVCNLVHDKDEFDHDRASGEPPVHRVPWLEDRGAMLGAYCTAWFKDGGSHTEVMTKGEIDAIRARSRASENGPWVTDYNQMARKTVVRRASHYWPLSPNLMTAVEIEEEGVNRERFLGQSLADIPAPQIETVDEATGEVLSSPAPEEQLALEPEKASRTSALFDQLKNGKTNGNGKKITVRDQTA